MNRYEKYLEWHNGLPTKKDSSVHYSNIRFEKSEEQAELKTVEINEIIRFVNEFLEKLEIKNVISPKVILEDINIDYEVIKEKHNLKDKRDIVWMKFTKDGYLGVVAASNDVNFDIPKTKEDYDIKVGDSWKHTTSGIIIHNLKKEWDESFVLIFPLENLPEKLRRGDIERGIGNYLISKDVPILDFYSHNY